MSVRAPDPSAILESLGLSGQIQVTPVTGGADMAIWRVEHGGATSALRLFRSGQMAAAKREIAAMRAASERGSPVPAIHAEGTWQDRPAMLLTWMPGCPLAHELCARPWRAWSLGVAFGRMQARLHQIPAPAALQQEPRSWIDWAEPDPVLGDRLLAIASKREMFLHLDYHPLNVLVADRQVTAVLDWTNARAGDPRADLARTASILHFAPCCSGLPAPLASIIRRMLEAGWRHGYRALAGPIHGMIPFYAWAGMLMVRDLSPRLGRADLPWLTPTFLALVRSWADAWSEE
jgi:aminoglycoside phosphotransferase (APT) family kinase protein